MQEKLIADAKRVVKESQIWEMLSCMPHPGTAMLRRLSVIGTWSQKPSWMLEKVCQGLTNVAGIMASFNIAPCE
jgi:hypothetical protein